MLLPCEKGPAALSSNTCACVLITSMAPMPQRDSCCLACLFKSPTKTPLQTHKLPLTAYERRTSRESAFQVSLSSPLASSLVRCPAWTLEGPMPQQSNHQANKAIDLLRDCAAGSLRKLPPAHVRCPAPRTTVTRWSPSRPAQNPARVTPAGPTVNPRPKTALRTPSHAPKLACSLSARPATPFPPRASRGTQLSSPERPALELVLVLVEGRRLRLEPLPLPRVQHDGVGLVARRQRVLRTGGARRQSEHSLSNPLTIADFPPTPYGLDHNLCSKHHMHGLVYNAPSCCVWC